MGTLDKIVVEWQTPSNDGGTPILGYKLSMKKSSEGSYTLIYDGSSDPGTKQLRIVDY